MGTWNLLQLEQGLEAISMAVMTRKEGWSPEEVSVLCEQTRKEMRSPKIHCVFDLRVFSVLTNHLLASSCGTC